jgi:hypothetical protein
MALKLVDMERMPFWPLSTEIGFGTLEQMTMCLTCFSFCRQLNVRSESGPDNGGYSTEDSAISSDHYHLSRHPSTDSLSNCSHRQPLSKENKHFFYPMGGGFNAYQRKRVVCLWISLAPLPLDLNVNSLI